ncbi:EAL domain-containing protein [Microbulbifer sp. SAOS-129_SWC]|uniref:EAL domain-containing protein n=1 Tax=Microbulbifer sp. SAOS-129_SWC TaxID=3145235 RepID=UPI0032178039
MVPDCNPDGGQSRQHLWLSALLLAAISATFVVICKKFLSPGGGAAAVWFPDAIAITFLYRQRVRDWPLLLLAFLAADVMAGVAIGYGWLPALVYTSVSFSEILLAALLLRRFCVEEDYFDGPRQWLRFTFFSAILPPLAGAGLGALVAVARTGLPYQTLFPIWYLADFVGLLTLLPLALMCRAETLRSFRSGAALGRFLSTAAVVGASIYLVFEVALLPFVFVSLPLIWAATRLPLFQTLVVIFGTILAVALIYVGVETHANPALMARGDHAGVTLVVNTFVAALPAYAMAVYTNIERHRNARIVEMESSFRAAVEDSRIGMLLVSLEGRILQANRSFCEFVGYPEGELVGRSIFSITCAEDEPSSRELWRSFISGERHAPHLEKRYVHRDGHVVWGYLSCSLARDAHGEALYSVVQVEDIDGRKRGETHLVEAKERLQVTLSSIADAVISTDADCRINFMNPVAEQMMGLPLERVRGQPVDGVFRMTLGRDGESVPNPVAECLRLGEPVFSADGCVLHSKDGRCYDIKNSASPLKTERGALLGAVMVFQDVSESRQLIRQLTYKASHDDLTGLPNRDAFKRELLKAIESVRHSDECHALAYVDLDRFKVVNDSAGHLAGDALLKQISKYLRALLRTSDSVARLGGDEFGLLFRHCNKEQARLRCEQLIRQIVALRFPWNERVYDVGASVGITEINCFNDRLGDLLSQADVACYSAKHASRGTVMIYEMEQSAAAEQHREIIVASAIREALDGERLVLYAQPVARSGELSAVSHYEILVRMVDDGGDLMLPAAFIPAAERYGLMLQIDRWVVEQVLVRHAPQIAAQGMQCAVNLSAEALGDGDFQVYLVKLLEQTPIPLPHVGFEITETAMVNQMDNASHFVAELRRMGCKVALDDFGNGLSSFNYLKAFSIDYIKIDGSFVRQVESNFVDLIIVESIHQVAHRLGARTIAEYVEDASTAARLRTIGVDLLQGYHIGRPLPLQEMLQSTERELLLEVAAADS